MSQPRTRLSHLMALCIVLITGAPRANGAVAGSNVQRFDRDHVFITWIDSAPVDVYLTDRPDRNIEAAKVLSEANRDGRHMAAVTADKRHYFILRDRTDGDLVLVSERLLPLERGSNFRDIGGYKAADGKQVRWGLIYRSGATPLLSDHDVAYIRALGLQSMIDLRSTEERQLAPTRLGNQGIRYSAVDYSLSDISGNYEYLLTALAPQYRALFRELVSNKGPMSYNCTGGQDRTGVATALILSALGVPRDTILDDYHLSTADRRPQYEMPALDPGRYAHNPAALLFAKYRLLKPAPLYSADGRSLLAALFDAVDARWGSVDNYITRELGVGPEELALLRANYLE